MLAQPAFLNLLSKVLLRCWVLGLGLVLVWFGVFLFAGDLVHRLHGGMFGLSHHELNVIFYCGMGLAKLLVLIAFFIPWVAIRMMNRNG